MIDYSVLCVVFTSSWFQVKACVMKIQVSSVTPKRSLKPRVPNIFSVFLLPCACAEGCTLWQWLDLGIDYSSYKKFPGFLNLLFVTKFSRIKEKNSFYVKKMKAFKRKWK